MEIIRGIIEPAAIRTHWQQLKAERKLRNREAAEALGVSEGQLIGSLCGANATRLAVAFPDIVKRLEHGGLTMALTRNEACVHERVGQFEEVSHSGHVGLVLGPDIDLRIFYGQWQSGFAVDDSHDGGPGRSLQFFDARGSAVHKIYMRDDRARDTWQRLVTDFAAADQTGALEVDTSPLPAPKVVPDDEVDLDGFHSAWAALRDTHDFFGLLKRYGLGRTQALRVAEPRFAYRVPTDAPTRVLNAASDAGVSIMVFVGNPGCIQIHTGTVKQVKPMGPWINVMDPAFNLHLRQDLVTEAWVVRKPTTDGIVTSLEAFDADGGLIAQFFGARKPGIPEQPEWRDLIDRSLQPSSGRMQ